LEKLPPTVRPLFEKALQDNKPERPAKGMAARAQKIANR